MLPQPRLHHEDELEYDALELLLHGAELRVVDGRDLAEGLDEGGVQLLEAVPGPGGDERDHGGAAGEHDGALVQEDGAVGEDRVAVEEQLAPALLAEHAHVVAESRKGWLIIMQPLRYFSRVVFHRTSLRTLHIWRTLATSGQPNWTEQAS